ncbi:major histocompatibility complex class I-related gene protein-like [Girardinichthys multiradiatus]|uniref:major histocompatibility complex class I-related gene protein-like n=1 Tax=Girardinichthys multiradiatus TaxID=208333 RepID=UPI001FACFD3B|nr:major histocompatibility complex class I-related gene protein-like [Girardinichthys multiradiatus]
MYWLIGLIFFYHATSSEKHSLTFYLMVSSGVSNIPEYVGYTAVDEVVMVYYDNNIKIPQPRQDWAREIKEKNPQHWEGPTKKWLKYLPTFKKEAASIKEHQNQTEGDIVQQILGCEWDDELNKVEGYKTYSLNGEDYIRLDTETATWVALSPKAEITEKEWNKKEFFGQSEKDFLTINIFEDLKLYYNYAKNSLHRKVLPSVSLLQKTPSSPVSCHATGFYPDKAGIFWRKDEKELNEDVEYGEILPNFDGTFQISANLNNSSVLSEDWNRYDCVFQLSGEKNDIITKLDKMVTRTNWGKTETGNTKEKSSDPMVAISVPVLAAVLAAVVILIAAVVFTVHRRKKAPDSIHELSQRLNPENSTSNTAHSRTSIVDSPS